MNRLNNISQAFSKSVNTYESHSLIQKFVAQRMAARILNENKSSLGITLEIGCGMGTLSELLVPHSDFYVLSDISKSLLDKASEKVRQNHVSSILVDGEYPCFTASFDVIVSNLVFHWFQDPKLSIKGLVACLKPGGKLYFSTLGNNSFHEWRTAHLIEGAPCGILDFMSFGELKDCLPLSGTRNIEEEWLKLNHQNSLQFLRVLKGVGGCTAHPAYKPLPHGTFKKIMADYDRKPETSCQILFGFYQKPETVREE